MNTPKTYKKKNGLRWVADEDCHHSGHGGRGIIGFESPAKEVYP